jgi:hydrogenase maturation protease
MVKRIICVGNRFRRNDSAGPLVYDYLAGTWLSEELELIDGGLAGLDLLRFVEGSERVVFVDAVTGFGDSRCVVVLDGEEGARYAGASYDHYGGLSYLLRMLPAVLEGAMPEIFIVGVQGSPDSRAIAHAADTAMKVAFMGNRGYVTESTELQGLRDGN